MKWSIEMAVESGRPINEDLADDIIEALKGHGPAVSLYADFPRIRFDIDGEIVEEAIFRAQGLLIKKTPFVTPFRVVEIQAVADQERELGLLSE